MSYLDNEVGRVENVDQNEAIAKLLDDSRALDASYQAMARIRQLSLGDYLS
jgi:flagellin-like hook-associated protein FlgL